MKLITAYKVLDKQCDWLGVDWERLMHLLATPRMSFPLRVVEAYDRVMEDRVPA